MGICAKTQIRTRSTIQLKSIGSRSILSRIGLEVPKGVSQKDPIEGRGEEGKEVKWTSDPRPEQSLRKEEGLGFNSQRERK